MGGGLQVPPVRSDSDAADGTGVETPTDRPVLLFDGVCNLCTGSVQWIIEHDPEGQFQFASLQSEAGQTLLAAFGLPTDEFDSVVLIEGEKYYAKSTAALRVAKRLGLPYAALYPFVVVPRFVRDSVYDFVAETRYRVFGKRDSCMVPGPDIEDRFLE